MDAQSLTVRDIPLSELDVSPLNTRKDLGAGAEDSSLENLAESIARMGLLEPVTVRPATKGRWELIAGQRRYLACKSLGWKTIPAIVRDQLDDAAATSLSLIENVHRADMAPLDKAHAFLRLVEDKGNVTSVARATGFSEQTIRRYLDLTRLPQRLQAELSTKHGPIGIEALSTLARIFPDDEEAMEAYDRTRGFTRDVQSEILKQSEGDLSRLDQLAERAREGLFNVRTCSDGFCFYMDDQTKNAFRASVLSGHLSLHRLVEALSVRPT